MEFSIIDNLHSEEKGDNFYLTPYAKLNLECIEDFNVKSEVLKLLEDKIK